MRFQSPPDPSGEKNHLAMTALIDIVFLLLIFFVMTLKIVAPEGDLPIQGPEDAAIAALPEEMPFPPQPLLIVQLRSRAGGRLASIQFGDRSVSDFDELRRIVRQMLDATAGERFELELQCDEDLHYEHVMNALTAVSGYVAPDGRRFIKLIDNVHLASRG